MASREPQLNKRQLQYQATQDGIYAAVNALVKVMSFDKIRIQDICEGAGISLGTFYHYFSNKNDLLIDRYKRTNRHFAKFYKDELEGLHAVDALKRTVTELAKYTKTRLQNILVPYYVAYLQNAKKWHEEEASAIGRIYKHFIRKGLDTGEIRSSYTANQIFLFLSNESRGVVVNQCLTEGAYLNDKDALYVLLDWIEGLRG